MEHALREWDKKAKADRMWANANNYFSKEYANRRKHQTIEAKQAGFGSANQAKEEQEANDDSDFITVTKEILQQIKSSESREL